MIAHGRQVHPAPPRQLLWQSKNGQIVFLPANQGGIQLAIRKDQHREMIETCFICTFLNNGWPSGRGDTETLPFNASSNTVAETVVLMGTPSLLSKKKEQNQESDIQGVRTKHRKIMKTDFKMHKIQKGGYSSNLNSAANIVFTVPKLERSSSSSWFSHSTA